MATYKQKQAFNKLVDFGGCITKAMVAAGYSKATAKTPKKVTESKGWKELTGQYGHDFEFDQEELAKRLGQLLDAVTIGHYTFPNSTTDGQIKEVIESVPEWVLINVERNSQCAKANFSRPDNATQFKSLVLGLKLHGLLGGGNNKASDAEDQVSQEAREAIARVRKIFPDSQV